MTFERWFSAKAILEDALEAPEQARQLVVEARCGADTELRAQVLEMVACHTGLADTLKSSGTRLPALPGAAEVVGARYRLEEPIGRGAFGRVHRAFDLRGERDVAVKLLALGPLGATPRGIRRELAALRRARLPGMVELLDDGIEEHIAWVVMRLVTGEPFPGPDAPVSWPILSPLADSLLRGVDRLHAIGVLHRDLKPANALVENGERVTLVDLGIALDLGGGDTPAPGGAAGTPSHMAPELLEGGPSTVRSDLYAAGVMLFEALAGRPPHDAKSLPELLTVRCEEQAPRADEVADGVPAVVADAIARALDRDPDRRPASAREFLDLIFPDRPGPQLPRIGDGADLERVMEAAKAGRSLFVTGEVGTGRSRLLLDAESILIREGYRVERPQPSREPLGSLLPLLGREPEGEITTLEEAEDWARRLLRGRLQRGVVLFVDDPDMLDASSSRALYGVRDAGAVVQVAERAPAGEDALRTRPLDAAALGALFRGPDRLLHLREDAAAALYARTRGFPGRVATALADWERDGIVYRDGDRFVATRASLDSLLPAAPAPPLRPGPRPELGHDAERLVGLLEVAGSRLSPDAVRAALGLPRWRAAAAVSDLESLGIVARGEDDVLELVLTVSPAEELSAAEVAQLHSALADALPRESESRIDHLLAADRIEEVGVAACEVAEGLLQRGEPERAHRLLGEALSAVRRERLVDVAVEERALVLLLEAALAVGTVPAIDALVYQVERASSAGRTLVDVELLARAGLRTVQGDSDRAIASTDLEEPLARSDLALLRHVIRVVAARGLGAEQSRSVLAEALVHLRSARPRDRRAHAASWLGWFRYRSLEFGRAASLHARAAKRWRNPRERLSARLNAASAAMEDGQLELAGSLAAEALHGARAGRRLLSEVRAEWLLRCVAYRSGAATDVDHELLDAARLIESTFWRGLLFLVEAAVAWRVGKALLATRLAREAEGDLKVAGRADVALLMRALAAAAGGGEDAADAEPELSDCPRPRIRAQAAALFALAGTPVPDTEREAALQFVSKTAETNADRLDQRCEVLSLAEVREILGEM